MKTLKILLFIFHSFIYFTDCQLKEYEFTELEFDPPQMNFQRNSKSFHKGPFVDLNNSVFYFKIKRNKGFISNKDKGILFWFYHENTGDLKFLEEKENDTDFNLEGLGIKLNELSIVSIVKNSTTKLIISDFQENKYNNKITKFECDISNSEYTNFKITFWKGNVILEYLEYTQKRHNTENESYKFCFIYDLWNDIDYNKNYSLAIHVDLQNEIIDYSIQNKINSKLIFSKKELKDPLILEMKSEQIKKLSQSIKSQDESNGNIHNNKILEIINNLNDKSSVILTKINYDPQNINLNTERKLIEYIYDLIKTRQTYIKPLDPRENFLKTLDRLNHRQVSMNKSLYEMYHLTLTNLEFIKTKAEKMEEYQTFLNILFFLIFVNALIIYFMYRNIKEKESLSLNGVSEKTRSSECVTQEELTELYNNV